MNSILKNASTFLTVLETAHLPRVSCWEEKDLSLALKWAEHHQQLYCKFGSDTKARNFLDTEFRKLSFRSCVLLDEFCFDFLQHSREVLLASLRCNPNLSTELRHRVTTLEGSDNRVTALSGSDNPRGSAKRNRIPYFKCSIVVDEPDADIPGVLCGVIDRTCHYQDTWSTTTEAPTRAIRTLLARAAVSKHPARPYFYITSCFTRGSEQVKCYILDWIKNHGGERFWLECDIESLTSCCRVSPPFTLLHITFILRLFNALHDTIPRAVCRHRLPTPETGKVQERAYSSGKACKAADLVFEKDGRDNVTMTLLLSHVFNLHACSGEVQKVILTLLGTLVEHQKLGSLAKSILQSLCGNYESHH